MITERAMLAAVHISIWTAIKHDRKVSREVAEQHAAYAGAGRYNKQLLREADRLESLRSLSGQIRQYFPAIGPIQRPFHRIEVQIDRFRKTGIKNLNVRTVLGRPSLRTLDVGPTNSAQTRVVTTLLRPIEFTAVGVYRNADAPFPRIRSWPRIAQARIHERLDFRPVKVCSHHPHAFPVRPVKLAAPLLQLELLRRERAARRNDGDHVLAIEIRPHDRAIIADGITHIGPVDVPSSDIEHQAIGQLPVFVGMVFRSEPSACADRMRPPLRSRKKSLPDVIAPFASTSIGVEVIALIERISSLTL